MSSQCLCPLSFFAPKLSEFNTDEENAKAAKIRSDVFNMIMREQFQLSYFGHISYEASDNMSVMERHTMFSIVLEQKTDEKKAREEAMKKSESKRKGWRHR